MAGSAGVDGLGSGGLSYVERPPVAALADLVSSVWIQQVAPGAEPYTQRNIPNGGVELLCPVGAVPRIVGPLTRPLVEVLAPGTTVVGGSSRSLSRRSRRGRRRWTTASPCSPPRRGTPISRT